jgi:hypothetical protein
MKNTRIYNLLVIFLLVSCVSFAQDSTKKELNLTTRYFSENNKVMFLEVNTKFRGEKGFQPVSGTTVQLYLDAEAEDNAIAKVTTDEKGIARTYIPPYLKQAWDSSSEHTIIAVSSPTKDFEESRSQQLIKKSRISIDTSSTEEAKSVTVSVTSFDGTAWVPVKDVEMRIGIKRSGGGLLTAGSEETYTTDSTGSVTMEVRKDTIPGDEKGNIVLMARVDDNEELGNLMVEKQVKWGNPTKIENNFFDQRTLWSTRMRTPAWLLVMAYSIVISVWGTIFYLIYQIVKIKKLSYAKDIIRD